MFHSRQMISQQRGCSNADADVGTEIPSQDEQGADVLSGVEGHVCSPPRRSVSLLAVQVTLARPRPPRAGSSALQYYNCFFYGVPLQPSSRHYLLSPAIRSSAAGAGPLQPLPI